LFGSVGTKEIAEAVVDAGGDTDKSEVQLPHGAIRETGTYDITIDLGYDVQASIGLTVARQGGGDQPLVEPETGEELTSNEADESEDSVAGDESATDEEKTE